MAPLEVELINLLVNLGTMSNNLNLELGYYISLTDEGTLAAFVIFGTEGAVDMTITAKDIKDLSIAMPSFNWSQITAFGHTHTMASGYGYSVADIKVYPDLMAKFPAARALLVQSSSEGFINALEIYGAYDDDLFKFGILEYCLGP